MPHSGREKPRWKIRSDDVRVHTTDLAEEGFARMPRSSRGRSRWIVRSDDQHVRTVDLDRNRVNLTSDPQRDIHVMGAMLCYGADERSGPSCSRLDCNPKHQHSGLVVEELPHTTRSDKCTVLPESSTHSFLSADSTTGASLTCLVDGFNLEVSPKTSTRCRWADLLDDSADCFSNADCTNLDQETSSTSAHTTASSGQGASTDDKRISQVSLSREDPACVGQTRSAGVALGGVDHPAEAELEAPRCHHSDNLMPESALSYTPWPCMDCGSADPAALLSLLCGSDVLNQIFATRSGAHADLKASPPTWCSGSSDGSSTRSGVTATCYRGSSSEYEGEGATQLGPSEPFASAHITLGREFADAESPADVDELCSNASSDQPGMPDGIRTPMSDDQDDTLADYSYVAPCVEHSSVAYDLDPVVTDNSVMNVDGGLCGSLWDTQLWLVPCGGGAEVSYTDTLHKIGAAQAAAVLRARQEEQCAHAADLRRRAKKGTAKSAHVKAEFGQVASFSEMFRPKSHHNVPKTKSFAEVSGREEQAITTLMIRNIPNQYTRKMLIKDFSQLGFADLYDFLYLPLDKDTRLNVGYAFVNFISPDVAAECRLKLEGFTFRKLRKSRVAFVSPAYLQGLERNLEHYRNSAVQCAYKKGRRPLFVGRAGAAAIV